MITRLTPLDFLSNTSGIWERVKKGDAFVIVFRGRELARFLPVPTWDRKAVGKAVLEMEKMQASTPLNRPGQTVLTCLELLGRAPR